MMNPPESIGALSNIPKEAEAPQAMPLGDMPEGSVEQVDMASMGYPSNLSDDDKVFIIQRMMQLGNEANNPYLSGDTGLKMLLQEKYGM